MTRQRVVNRVKLILPSAKVNKPENSSDQAQHMHPTFSSSKPCIFYLINRSKITGILLPTGRVVSIFTC